MSKETYLIRGNEPEERVELLLSLTSIRSEPTRAALKGYLCKGFSERDAANIHDIKLPNFSRALSVLDKVAETVEAIKEIDWSNK